ncbi:MAG: sigma-70 family RNA polymerase sigma factor [Planctomycetes bacterium]|nr:sigma-70 family RNA polymerase sigma factor [Planctomycetota bacterium]
MQDKGFTKLVDDHSRLVLNAAYRVLGSRTSAEDVHQDVFTAIWQRWESFNGDTSWPAYLYRCAVRKAIDHAKASRKTRSIDAISEPAATGSADSAAITTEMKDKLAACISKLPDRQAEVFVMYRIEGKSYNQIAEVLQCKLQTARVHMHRALTQLAKDFKEYL